MRSREVDAAVIGAIPFRSTGLARSVFHLGMPRASYRIMRVLFASLVLVACSQNVTSESMNSPGAPIGARADQARPPVISGGTLLASARSPLAFVANPDFDRVDVVDL